MYTGVARGCTGCTCTPQGGEKFGGQIYIGESCKCTPRQRKSPIFEEIWEIWRVGVVSLVLLAGVLMVTTKIRSSTFSSKKSAPPEKMLATPMPTYAVILYACAYRWQNSVFWQQRGLLSLLFHRRSVQSAGASLRLSSRHGNQYHRSAHVRSDVRAAVSQLSRWKLPVRQRTLYLCRVPLRQRKRLCRRQRRTQLYRSVVVRAVRKPVTRNLFGGGCFLPSLPSIYFLSFFLCLEVAP